MHPPVAGGLQLLTENGRYKTPQKLNHLFYYENTMTSAMKIGQEIGNSLCYSSLNMTIHPH